jgi:hydrogenase expression/formation protein HypE
MMNESLKRVKLAHGSGQGLEELLHEIILPALYPNKKEPVTTHLPATAALEDAYTMDIRQLFGTQPSSPPLTTTPGKLAFTTDSFVVHPLVFPGGDIGKLAACGTINDLAMMSARPLLLSVALIIEEGLEIELLKQLLGSLRNVCAQTGVTISCGDTKVVEKNKADGLFINTSGIGVIPADRNISVANARPGDLVMVSGPVGLHGIAILAARKNLNFASAAVSDCVPLNGLVEELLNIVPGTRILRDCTRGGCAAVLNEIAQASQVSITLQQEQIPVPDVVRGACSFLGIDPLHIACEGRFIAVLPGTEQEQAERAIRFFNSKSAGQLGQGAALIGRVTGRQQFPVMLETAVGGTRLVDTPPGELLPRIC